MATVIFATPVGKNGMQNAEAVSVVVVGDVSPAGVLGPIKSAVSAAMNVQQVYFATWDHFKESVLDPLFWNLANRVISNMLNELTRWVNSGFDGSPAFVTDLDSFLYDVVDEAAGEFLADAGFDFLCSPFRLDVQIALNIQYQQAKVSDHGTTQCTLSDITGNVENFLNGTFSEGGWAGWFELTQGPANDPNKAFLEARERMRISLVTAQGRELVELASNDFFLNVEVCEEGVSIGGSIQNCTTSTLGTIVEHQLNSSLDATKQRLTFADEFDELVGALLAQIANQVIMGANGLLGLGGSSYSSNTYGSGGTSSYLDALAAETLNNSISGSADSIGDAIANELRYIRLQEDIVALVDGVEGRLDSEIATHGTCFRTRMSSSLTNARDDAEVQIIVGNNNILVLTSLQESFDAATTTESQIEIMGQFSELQAIGFAATAIGIVQTELDLEFILPDQITSMETAISNESRRCDRISNSSTNTGGER